MTVGTALVVGIGIIAATWIVTLIIGACVAKKK